MTPTERKTAILARLQRIQRPHPAAQARLQAAAQKWDNWQGTCRFCGAALTGTLAQIKGHKCDVA